MILGMIPGPTGGGVSRRLLLGLTASALLALSGCGSGEPTYYTLSPSPGPRLGGGPATIEIRTPSVASTLDRDAIVRNEDDNQLTLAHGNVWAGSLSGMIGRTLALDLAQRLPGSSIRMQGDAITSHSQAVVELDVSRFMENAADKAELLATLSVYREDSGPASSQSIKLTQSPADRSISTMVATLSQLLGQVADQAAVALRALPSSRMPISP